MFGPLRYRSRTNLHRRFVVFRFIAGFACIATKQNAMFYCCFSLFFFNFVSSSHMCEGPNSCYVDTVASQSHVANRINPVAKYVDAIGSNHVTWRSVPMWAWRPGTQNSLVPRCHTHWEPLRRRTTPTPTIGLATTHYYSWCSVYCPLQLAWYYF